MRIALHTCLPDNFLVCWPPVTALSVFHGNLPQKIWGTYFPHGESTSWNFPAKIRNSLRPIPSFDMMSKIPGSDHSCRRRYVAKLLAERINNNEIYICEAVCDAVREWSEVTRPSADCQTTFHGRFKRFGKILKKVAERSRDSGRRSRDRRPTVKQRFMDVSSDLGKFWKESLNGHATVVEVTRPSADCQTTFFGRFKQLEIFLKKVAERSRDSGRRSRDRPPTVKQRFLDVSSDLGKFWEKPLNGHATVVEVTRPSADCQTTFFGRF